MDKTMNTQLYAKLDTHQIALKLADLLLTSPDLAPQYVVSVMNNLLVLSMMDMLTRVFTEQITGISAHLIDIQSMSKSSGQSQY
jgi:hypothetical protein